MITNFRCKILCPPKYFPGCPEIFPGIFRKFKQKPPWFNRISRKPGDALRTLVDHLGDNFNKNYIHIFRNLTKLSEFYSSQKFFAPVYSENTNVCTECHFCQFPKFREIRTYKIPGKSPVYR